MRFIQLLPAHNGRPVIEVETGFWCFKKRRRFVVFAQSGSDYFEWVKLPSMSEDPFILNSVLTKMLLMQFPANYFKTHSIYADQAPIPLIKKPVPVIKEKPEAEDFEAKPVIDLPKRKRWFLN